MSDITVASRSFLLDRHQQHILERTIAPMELGALGAFAAMNAVGEVFRYAQIRLATDLPVAQQLQEAVEDLTPTQNVAFNYLTNVYLETMGVLTKDACETILRLAVQMPAEVDGRSGLVKFIDGVLDR